MLTLDELTPEAKEALIACYRIAAARGRQLRLERQKAATEKGKNDPNVVIDVKRAERKEVMVIGETSHPSLVQPETEQMPEAQDGCTIYNNEPRSTLTHESMDNNDRSDHDQRLSPCVSV